MDATALRTSVKTFLEGFLKMKETDTQILIPIDCLLTNEGIYKFVKKLKTTPVTERHCIILGALADEPNCLIIEKTKLDSLPEMCRHNTHPITAIVKMSVNNARFLGVVKTPDQNFLQEAWNSKLKENELHIQITQGKTVITHVVGNSLW